MYKVALFLILSLGAFASNLNIVKGEIKAHTEIFGDSEINPQTTHIKSLLTIDDKIESIKGEVFFETLSLVSSKKDRDEHMYKLLDSEVHKVISFTIKNIIKNETNYDINGVISLNGVKKEITVKSDINEENNQIVMVGGFSFNLTDFNLEPPTLLFLTVRNQIDINYNIELKR